MIAHALGARSYRYQEIVRGTPEDLRQPGTLWPDDVRIMAEMAPVIELGDPESR